MTNVTDKNDTLVDQARFEGIPYVAGDNYQPVHADGHSDLNLHMLDMLDPGDADSDPFKVPGSIPGEPTPQEGS